MDEADFARANARAARADRTDARAVSARYLPARGRLVVVLSNGAELSVPVEIVEGLAGAAPADLREIEVTPAGTGLHFPRLDADVFVPTLIEGVTGSARWMARHLGHAGGSARTERKAEAARRNGRLGGRPRKVAEQT